MTTDLASLISSNLLEVMKDASLVGSGIAGTWAKMHMDYQKKRNDLYLKRQDVNYEELRKSVDDINDATSKFSGDLNAAFQLLRLGGEIQGTEVAGLIMNSYSEFIKKSFPFLKTFSPKVYDKHQVFSRVANDALNIVIRHNAKQFKEGSTARKMLYKFNFWHWGYVVRNNRKAFQDALYESLRN